MSEQKFPSGWDADPVKRFLEVQNQLSDEELAAEDDRQCSIRERFEKYAALGLKHSFKFKSGHDFLGWVSEVGEKEVFVSWAPSPFYAQATGSDEMSPDDEWVKFTDIEESSLSYWDKTAHCWINF